MIVFDTPTVWNPSYGPSAHLISSLINKDAALKELLDFGAEIGLKSNWLQKRRIPWHTHFDIWGWKLSASIENGAKMITKKQLFEIMQQKKMEFYRLLYNGQPTC